MALDRQSIERRDFPVGRRGYDTQAVDAHLSSVAEQLDELKLYTRRRSDTLATSASERVQSIVEAAESSAADIRQDAENDARVIREQADQEVHATRAQAAQEVHATRAQAAQEVHATRAQAAEQAREHVGKVAEATGNMMARLESIESELGALIGSLRASANRLGSELQQLEANLGELSERDTPRPGFMAGPASELPAGDFDDGFQASEVDPAVELEPGEGGDDSALGAEDVGAGQGGAPPAAFDDAEGARLVALNMALNGTTRDETWRYLLENFQLSDASGLLDEVYASVEG